ncbi:MAG: hypothetical protein U9N36_12070 [Euryarchaeota archaeon]|nr:hypothetical protein [Euryarchaeota archaeon]
METTYNSIRPAAACMIMSASRDVTQPFPPISAPSRHSPLECEFEARLQLGRGLLDGSVESSSDPAHTNNTEQANESDDSGRGEGWN